MNNPAVAQAAQKYGLDFIEVLPAQKGYRNFSYQIKLRDGSRANLIIYKNEPAILTRIRLANKLSGYLDYHNLPVRHTLDKRILVINANRQKRYASLYNYLPGHTIPWEAYTKEHLKLLGQSMAAMHQAMTGFEDAEVPSVEEEYLNLLERMQKYFANKGVVDAMDTKLNLRIATSHINFFKVVLKAAKHLPERQPLHMDFVRSNVLFDGADNKLFVSGIIDFEKAAYGHQLFDICRTLAFLYVDCKFKTPDEVRRYFLQSGYAKRGGSKLISVKFGYNNRSVNLEDTLVQLFWLHDFYKFLKHNPYESLTQNEHFVRTQGLLLTAGLLERTR